MIDEEILGIEEVMEMMLENGTDPRRLVGEYIRRVPESREFLDRVTVIAVKVVSKHTEEPKGFFFEDGFNNPTKEKGTFVPKWLGDMIMKKHFFKTPEDEQMIYVYNAGCYHPIGEVVIAQDVAFLMGKRYKNRYNSEVSSYISAMTMFKRNSVSDLNLVNLQNGIYNIETGELLSHNPTLFFLQQLPVDYTINADCPKIKEFVSQIVAEEDIPVVQEIIGYCLWRDYPMQKAVMLIGDGSNGKSTLLNLIKEFLGITNVTSVALQDFDTSRFASSNLYGKLANLYADLPDAAMKRTGKFKMLTGGDPILGERKFKSPFLFKNYAKLIFSTNKIPESYDDTDAFYRRWVFVNFPNKFEGDTVDKNILKKLTTPEELSGLFIWALEGLTRVLKENKFSNEWSTEIMRDIYDRMSSPVKAFEMDMVEKDPDGVVIKVVLYQTFLDYCRKMGLPTMSDVSFSKKVKEFFIGIGEERKKIGNKRPPCWIGIRLKDVDENDFERMRAKWREWNISE